MSANTFGELFRLTSFGESHGVALGAVIDGCPAGVRWDTELLKRQLERRRPGQSQVVTSRNETDVPEILSGVFEGKTLGTPIAVIIRNSDARSDDYKGLTPRAGHADDVWKQKFGHSDPRGGGRSSGRETLARVVGGAVAAMFVREVAPDLMVRGFANRIGPFGLEADERNSFASSKGEFVADSFVARFPSKAREKDVEKLLLDAKAEGKSYGGTAEIWIDGAPANLGQPVFRKFKADLAAAMMSVGATSGFEVGAGEEATRAEGNEFHAGDGQGYGGIRGGISTGEQIVLRVHFKPTSSVMDIAKKGRHDPCIVPRAIAVLEAMAWLVIADHLLWSRLDRARP